MTAATLKRRLAALEAGQSAVRSLEAKARAGRVRATFAAIMDAHGDDDSAILAFYGRLKAGSETDADRAILAALPACHVSPLELLRVLIEDKGFFQ